MINKNLRPAGLLGCTIAVTFFALLSSATGQTTTTIVNDDFSDGITDTTGTGNQLDFFTTTSGSALDQPNNTTGPLDFATGTSGRTIHGLFAPQTLALVGDQLEVVFDFTTPATIGTANEDFRFGLFSTAGSPNGQADFAMDLSASSGSPNPILNTLAGFHGEIDNINAGGTDLGIRTHNVNSVVGSGASTGGSSPQGFPSGQLLNTTQGFDFISGGDDDVTSLAPNTDYTGSLLVELLAGGELEISVGISGIGTNGVAFNDVHTDQLSIADVPGGDIGVNTTTFDFLAFQATSGAFGSSSANGDPDNGIDINNIAINFTTTAVVPEPGSAMLLLSGLGALGLVRRRR